jgi:hypothetical protein
MKKRDTYKRFLLKKLFGIDSTYYKSNPKFTRSNQAPMHLALVIDGVVEDIIHCEEHLGYILLSEPKVVDIGENFNKVNIYDIYDEVSDKFIKDSNNV